MNCPNCHFENPEGIKICGNCGHDMISYELASYEIEGNWLDDRRINALALVGVAIGFIAILLPWYWIEGLGDISFMSILRIPLSGGAVQDTVLIASCYIFLIGTMISIISPIGGVAEFAGILAFLVDFMTYPWRFTQVYMPHPFLEIGPYLGLISAIIVLISILKPIGIGYGKGTFGIKGRLINFGKA